MAMLYMEGFDTLTTADLADRYGVFGCTVLPGGRFGTSFCRNTNINNYLNRSFPPRSTLIIGMIVRFPTIAGIAIMALKDTGTNQCSLQLNSDGSFSVVRYPNVTVATSLGGLLRPNLWYTIEWKVTVADIIPANSCVVRVNGIEVLNVPAGQDLQYTTNATANSFSTGGWTGSWDLDEFYICDDQGTVNNDFLGDGKVTVLRPVGIGTWSLWTPTGGNAHWQNVDEPTPNDDTDYNSTDTVGEVDSFLMGDLPFTPAKISGIMASIQVRKDDVGSRQVAIVLRSGGAEFVGTPQIVTDDYTSLVQVWETDPLTGLPWTKDAVNSLEVGYKLIA